MSPFFYFKLFPITLISCLGILVYSNTFFCTFHYDDFQFIVNNPAIKNIHDLPGIWHFFHGRFITFLSLALNYHFNGIHVFGYHLFNLAVHLITAILVWWFTFLTLSTAAMKEDSAAKHAPALALLAGLVFISHPVQTEAVTNIWQRAASMTALFYLASLCFYIKSRQHLVPLLKSSFYVCSLISAVAAMFTKENSVTLPLMILLYEFTFFRSGKKLDWKFTAPFLLTLLIVPVTFLFLKSQTFQKMHGTLNSSETLITPMNYFLTQFRAMVTYVRLVFIPVNQNLDYDYPVYQNLLEWPVLASLLFLMIVLCWTKRLFSKYRLLSFSIVWFFLTLTIPESSFWAMGDVICEHRLYLPLAGYSIFLVSGIYYGVSRLCRYSERSEGSIAPLRSITSLGMTVMLLTLIIAANSFLTYQRNKIWENNYTLWADVLRKSPNKVKPNCNIGNMYSRAGNLTKAMLYYNKALATNPHYAGAYFNRALIYSKQSKYALAVLEDDKALDEDPSLVEAYINRGNAYFKLGRIPQAISDYTSAVNITPDNADAYFNRGACYARSRKAALADLDYKKSSEIRKRINEPVDQ